VGSERLPVAVGGGESGNVRASLNPLPFSSLSASGSTAPSLILGRELAFEVVLEYLAVFALLTSLSSVCV